MAKRECQKGRRAQVWMIECGSVLASRKRGGIFRGDKKKWGEGKVRGADK